MAADLSSVPVSAHVRQIDIAECDLFPNTPSAQRATATVRDLTTRINRIAWNCPRIPETHTRQVASNDQLANTLRRHTKKC